MQFDASMLAIRDFWMPNALYGRASGTRFRVPDAHPYRALDIQKARMSSMLTSNCKDLCCLTGS